jgi:hypothetical protein
MRKVRRFSDRRFLSVYKSTLPRFAQKILAGTANFRHFPELSTVAGRKTSSVNNFKKVIFAKEFTMYDCEKQVLVIER